MESMHTLQVWLLRVTSDHAASWSNILLMLCMPLLRSAQQHLVVAKPGPSRSFLCK